MKALVQSKTFWLAILQSLVAIVTIFATEYPVVGELLIAKSFLDIILRCVSTQLISLGGYSYGGRR